MPKCQACQAPLKGDERFCGNCGAANVVAPPSPTSSQPPSQPPAVSTGVRPVFISSQKAEAASPRGSGNRILFGGLLVAAISIASPLVFKALNRPPELTPEDCIRSILKVNGVDVFSDRKQRILDRIASMNCTELNAMLQEAKQNEQFKNHTFTALELKNASVLADAMKLRANVAGCQVAPDGGYAEPGATK